MKILTWIAYGIFAVSALGVAIALSDSDITLTVSFCLLSVTGVLFMAFEKAISTLIEIRDALLPTVESVDTVKASPDQPTRSIEEISRDLEAIKSRTSPK